MAGHWSRFVSVTERQARALDRMAKANDMGDGMSVLMAVSGCSRSKVGKLSRLSVQGWIDDAFARYGRGER